MRTPISVKQGMEKLASHSGLIHIGTLLDSIPLKERIQNLIQKIKKTKTSLAQQL